METKDKKCLALAEARSGLITRREARQFLSTAQLERRLASRLLMPVFRGVYRVAGAPESWRQKAEALLLWAGPHAALSHQSAAALHGFEHFPEGPLEVTLLSHRRKPSGVVLHLTDAFAKADVSDAGLRVTSIERTLIDLCAKNDRYTMRATIDQALRKTLTTLDDLRAMLERSKHRPGAPDFRDLLHEFDGGGGPSESELEEVMFALIESAELPKPVKQKSGKSGDKRVRVDLLFEDYGVIIEGDGYAYHSGIDSFEADRERNNLLTASGYLVLHWTWTAMHEQPEELINVLLATLNAQLKKAGR